MRRPATLFSKLTANTIAGFRARSGLDRVAMVRAIAAATVIGLVLTAQGHAANCKKGKPCGNSCIAQDKVCRIGAPSSPAEPGRFDRHHIAPTETTRQPAEISCRWSGRVYRVPEALCLNGGGFPVR